MSANNNQNPQVSEGQFGQKGQYGAVTGQGFGGGLAKDSQGRPLNETQAQNQDSNYSGYGQNDSESQETLPGSSIPSHHVPLLSTAAAFRTQQGHRLEFRRVCVCATCRAHTVDAGALRHSGTCEVCEESAPNV